MFTCLVGWLEVEVKKNYGTIFKKTTWAGVNTGMGMRVHGIASPLTRATILGTLCIISHFSSSKIS